MFLRNGWLLDPEFLVANAHLFLAFRRLWIMDEKLAKARTNGEALTKRGIAIWGKKGI
ncbi:hypothetical protein [Paenibacillus azoreducens]|uniref:Uncharacterized protein n=1 Tax=Paenibacillus azoreducens TaxID=116718 RepID=A0A919YIM1_9BACL|nr:hypothetical protein [Paenibacillus azoreducens]GIO51164.1 hypothetical protein J34TS1_59290 [Paenibacillus azoreducens]